MPPLPPRSFGPLLPGVPYVAWLYLGEMPGGERGAPCMARSPAGVTETLPPPTAASGDAVMPLRHTLDEKAGKQRRGVSGGADAVRRGGGGAGVTTKGCGSAAIAVAAAIDRVGVSMQPSSGELTFGAVRVRTVGVTDRRIGGELGGPGGGSVAGGGDRGSGAVGGRNACGGGGLERGGGADGGDDTSP